MQVLDLIDPETAVSIASSWHGGQRSPLYSFASCGGKIHSEDHRARLEREIGNNMDDAIERSSTAGVRILGDLLMYVRHSAAEAA